MNLTESAPPSLPPHSNRQVTGPGPIAKSGLARTERRLVALIPALGIVATLGGVAAAGDDQLTAYLILGLGIIATALLVVLARNWSARAQVHEQTVNSALDQLRRGLAEQEALWRQNPALLFRTDAGGVWTQVNEALAQTLRTPAPDLLGGAWWGRLDRHDQAALSVGWQEALSQRTPFVGQCRYLTPEGEKLWLEVAIAPLADAPGFSGSLVAIDRQRALARTITELEEQRDHVLDALNAAFFDWNVSEAQVRLSRQWLKILGGAPEACTLSARELESLTHPEDRGAIHAQAVAAMNGATPFYHVEHRVRNNQGQWLWIESHGKVVARDPDGSARRMIGYNLEISSRKRLEAALRDAEAHHAQVLDDMSEVLFRTDATGNWTYLNATWTELTGHAVDESLGRPMQHFVHPEDRPEMVHLLRALTEGKLLEIRHEIRAAGKDGFDRWLELRMRPLKDGEGGLLGAAGSMHDVTDRHRGELELRRAKESAESANRVKTDFLANVSHEIRTPLHGIVGMTELLLEGPLDETQREHLQLIRGSSNTLLRTLNEVLDFSRIEAGKMGIELGEFNLSQALQQVSKSHALTAARKGLVLRLKVAPEVPEALTGDAKRLEQVLDHLLDNAVKFTTKGEIELAVQVRAELSERVMLEFVVRDTGSGFSGQQRDTLFNAFSHAARSGDMKKSGVGLGLAICKRLAEMMGGEVWAESAPGRGSTFHFTARFYRPNPLVGRAMALPATSVREQPKPSHSTGLSILLVEDDELNQKVAASVLRSLGHYPTAVGNGADAIVAWETTRYDLVIMDLQLPLMGGIEAARYIRAKEAARGGHQPIIAMTAHAESDFRTRCQEVAIDDFLVKPVEKDTLAAAVDRAAALLQAPRGEPVRRNPAHATLDLEGARARINNDEAMFRKILELFRLGYEQPLSRCRAAVAQGDGQALALAAHNLKGMAGNIGANALRAAASQLERQAREARRETFGEGFKALELALAEVLPEVDRELAPDHLNAAAS
ncbi:MAG: PAS domain-containing protein [Betaproteobacteria bacterium]|nr:PAS domain-containing protein [Betaproteobacteria bacterium]